MKLDVIIATYNRCGLLRQALDSLLAPRIPAGLSVHLVVVDNNSRDRTRPVVEQYQTQFPGRVSYLFEGRQGKSAALNTAIAATDGDLVGFIDDDEQVDAAWYECIQAVFAAGGVDFIGGPCKVQWNRQPPAWLPEDYPAVIGQVEAAAERRVFGVDFDGVLMGGNAVIRRAILERVGGFCESLGPVRRRLLAAEDEEMTQRLLAAGGRGLYLPELIIYHHLPPERLTKNYHRRWCFWRAVSQGVKHRLQPEPVPQLLGVPRHLYGSSARRVLRTAKSLAANAGNPAERFSDELSLWHLAGFFYGKHLYRSA